MGRVTSAAVMIPVSRGQYALVDAEDAPRIRKFSWQLKPGKAGNAYARNGRSTNSIYMHQLIVKYGRGQVVDHKNGDGLDNRKENLRVCSYQENARHRRPNTRRALKGYYWCKQTRKYRVDIMTSNGRVHIGVFSNPIDASKAYDAAALKYHGEFAGTNFPKEGGL